MGVKGEKTIESEQDHLFFFTISVEIIVRVKEVIAWHSNAATNHHQHMLPESCSQ